MREYCKKKLDREIEKGYNIFVSKYAEDEFGRANYDETYTEYRVQKLLERVKYDEINIDRRRKGIKKDI